MPDSGTKLIHFFETTYRPQRLADATEQCAIQYRTTMERFSWYLGHDATIHNLTDDTMEKFLAWLKAGGRANATCNGYRAHLLALWKQAWRKRLRDDLPRDVAKYKAAKRIPEAWSADEVARILNAAKEAPGSIGGIPACEWWPALLLTLYDTGLRIAALMKLKRSDLNSDRWLSVPSEVQKQNADQVFRLHPETMDAIDATDRVHRTELFPWPFDGDGNFRILAKHYRQILRRAGLPDGPRDLFHKLRRTSATAVCDAFDEQAAKKHLGHSSLTVTRRYIDPRLVRSTHGAADAIQRPRLDDPDAKKPHPRRERADASCSNN